MSTWWRRRGLRWILIASVALCMLGSVAVGLGGGRFRRTPPAVLLDMGPIWIGDFCRDNVQHRRYPPGWCPRDYTVYLIVRMGARSSIHPLFRIPNPIPLEPLT